jgi:hypothetical protein
MSKLIEIELRKIARELVDLMKVILDEQGHTASGRLKESFNWRVSVGRETIDLKIDNSTDYWEKIDDYGAYGKPVVVAVPVIIQWLKIKGLTGGMSAKEISLYAINIVKELAIEYPTQFGRGRMDRSNFVEKADLMAQKLGVYDRLNPVLNNEMQEYLKMIREEGVMDLWVG